MPDRFQLQSGSGILELQASTDDLLLPSSAVTVTAVSGSYALSGAPMGRAVELGVAVGVYTVAGVNTSLTATANIVADAGTYALTGIAAKMRRAVPLGLGTYAVTG